MESTVIKISEYDVLISSCDLEKIKEHKWYKTTSAKGKIYFAYCKSDKERIKLHRFIMDCPAGKCVDHINGNTLDNRRENLRICTQAENNFNLPKPKTNTSGYKGVYWNKAVRKWQALIQVNKKKIRLGSFETPEQAHKAYCEAAKKYHGDYRRVV